MKIEDLTVRRTVLVLLIIAIVIGVTSLAIITLRMTPQETEPERPAVLNPPVSSTNTTVIAPTIIGGFRPPEYTIGNLIDIDLLSGMASLDIEHIQDKVSIRFTAQESGSAIGLFINTFTVQGNPRLIFGLQEDIDGAPSGHWIGGDYNYGEVEVPLEKGFVKVKLSKAVTIVKNEVYHLVVMPSQEAEDIAAITAYLANSGYQPLNRSDPDINWDDNAINTLKYTETQWVIQNRYPIFMVELSDGTFLGQPYSLAAPWVIYGERYVGQTIVPAVSFKLEKIAFVINKMGEPANKLYYAIFNSTNSVLASETFASAEDTSLHISWEEVKLSEPVTLQAGQIYRITLFSPNTDLQNSYRLIGHEFTVNPDIGYGGLQHRLTISYDSGTTWFEWNDADTIFKLTTD